MIRLAIIEDNAVYSKALELYIKKVEGIEIVYLDRTIKNLIGTAAIQPHVVIMDIDLGKESGIEGVEKIKEVFPKAGVLMLTVFEDEEKNISINKSRSPWLLIEKRFT
jgi:DNA-binding NarL/FixJ family response regulator